MWKLYLFQVVGGMVWCISVCSYDVDVDLLFQENSSIGQKMFVLALCTDSCVSIIATATVKIILVVN